MLRTVVQSCLSKLCISLPVSLPVGKVQVPLVGGTGWHVYRELQKQQEFWKYRLFEALLDRNSGAFADVGVNLGQTLLLFRLADRQKPYLGFEPNPEAIAYVNRVIRQNGYENCMVFPCGLAERTSMLSLYLPQGAHTGAMATLVADLRPGRSFDVQQVAVFRFDELIEEVDSGPIDFVKLDVEGAELQVLHGMDMTIRRDRPMILCEVLFTDSHADIATADRRNEEIMKYLKDREYSVYQIVKSEDKRSIVAALPIQSFESAFWTKQNADLCDYIFIPEERSTQALDSLGVAN